MDKINYDGKLIIFTPCYDYRTYAPYTNSLLTVGRSLDALGIKWDYWMTLGDTVLERAVNSAYARFLRDDEATDILCIDYDETFDAEGVLRLLTHKEEVVGGAYRMKNDWEKFTAHWKTNDSGKPIGRILGDGTALLQAWRLPWGFLRVKKSALHKYIEKFPDLWYHGKDGKEHIFCELQYQNHQMVTQDFVFCDRLREAGVDVWLDPGITIGHWGHREYVGNLDTHLKGLEAMQEAERNPQDAFAVVEAMAKQIEDRKAA